MRLYSYTLVVVHVLLSALWCSNQVTCLFFFFMWQLFVSISFIFLSSFPVVVTISNLCLILTYLENLEYFFLYFHIVFVLMWHLYNFFWFCCFIFLWPSRVSVLNFVFQLQTLILTCQFTDVVTCFTFVMPHILFVMCIEAVPCNRTQSVLVHIKALEFFNF